MGTWWNGKAGSLQISFFSLRADVSNIAIVKINRKAVNKGKGKKIEVPYTITFTGSNQMFSKLKEVS